MSDTFADFSLIASAQAATAKSKDVSPADQPVPAEVSEMEDGNGKIKFQNDFGHPFYINDRDTKTKSVCDDACSETWAPVRAHNNAQPMGNWTLLDRGKGYMQWVYKGKPIYSNVPQVVTGSDPELNNDGHWHVLVP